MENNFRELGQYILDPSYEDFSNKQLINESSYELVEKVYTLFVEYVCAEDTESQLKSEFRTLVDRFHKARIYRNQIMHSAYFELKAGGEIVQLLRVNNRRSEKNNIKKIQPINKNSFENEMRELGEIGVMVGIIHKSLLRLYPSTTDRKYSDE